MLDLTICWKKAPIEKKKQQVKYLWSEVPNSLYHYVTVMFKMNQNSYDK